MVHLYNGNAIYNLVQNGELILIGFEINNDSDTFSTGNVPIEMNDDDALNRQMVLTYLQEHRTVVPKLYITLNMEPKVNISVTVVVNEDQENEQDEVVFDFDNFQAYHGAISSIVGPKRIPSFENTKINVTVQDPSSFVYDKRGRFASATTPTLNDILNRIVENNTSIHRMFYDAKQRHIPTNVKRGLTKKLNERSMRGLSSVMNRRQSTGKTSIHGDSQRHIMSFLGGKQSRSRKTKKRR